MVVQYGGALRRVLSLSRLVQQVDLVQSMCIVEIEVPVSSSPVSAYV